MKCGNRSRTEFLRSVYGTDIWVSLFFCGARAVLGIVGFFIYIYIFRLRAGGEGDDRGWDGWMTSLIQWTWVGWTPGVGDGQGGLVCCGSWGRKESDTTKWLNWTELMYIFKISLMWAVFKVFVEFVTILLLFYALGCFLTPRCVEA